MPYGWAAAAAVAIGTAVQTVTSNEARQQQKHANDLAQRSDAVKSQNAMAQMLQQNRVNAAQVFAISSNNGTGTSSGTQGAEASLGTQGAVQLNYMNTVNDLNQQRMASIQKAEGYDAIGSEYGGTLSSLGKSYFGGGGKIGG